MQHPPAPTERKAGFALVVVLASLLVLAALFAAAQGRVIARLNDAAAEATLIARGQISRELLDLAIAARTADPRATRVTASLGGEEHVLVLQDVGGLIDVNTASPELLARLGDGLGLSPSALEAWRAWRRNPRRAIRVEDFARVTGLPPERMADLRAVATVQSGRPGLAPDLAPAGVLARLGAGRPTASAPAGRPT